MVCGIHYFITKRNIYLCHTMMFFQTGKNNYCRAKATRLLVLTIKVSCFAFLSFVEQGPYSHTSYDLSSIVGFGLFEMAISNNPKPTVYRNLYENTDYNDLASTRLYLYIDTWIDTPRKIGFIFYIFYKLANFIGNAWWRIYVSVALLYKWQWESSNCSPV